MKIPNYIFKLLLWRRDTAERLLKHDRILSDWLDENNIKVDPADYRCGSEMLFNPDESMQRIIEAITSEETESVRRFMEKRLDKDAHSKEM